MNRRYFLLTAAAVTKAAMGAPRGVGPSRTRGRGANGKLELEELTLALIASKFADGTLTSRQLTEIYLRRIEALNRRGPILGAVLETNPDALKIAAELDQERQQHGSRGPLHGVPILIKDNIETADRMMTTAGSLALKGWYAPQDAPLIARLRAAGAVILGKTNLVNGRIFDRLILLVVGAGVADRRAILMR